MAKRKGLNRGAKSPAKKRPGLCAHARTIVGGILVYCCRVEGHPTLHRMGSLYWSSDRGAVISADSFIEANRDLKLWFDK